MIMTMILLLNFFCHNQSELTSVETHTSGIMKHYRKRRIFIMSSIVKELEKAE